MKRPRSECDYIRKSRNRRGRKNKGATVDSSLTAERVGDAISETAAHIPTPPESLTTHRGRKRLRGPCERHCNESHNDRQPSPLESCPSRRLVHQLPLCWELSWLSAPGQAVCIHRKYLQGTIAALLTRIRRTATPINGSRAVSLIIETVPDRHVACCPLDRLWGAHVCYLRPALGAACRQVIPCSVASTQSWRSARRCRRSWFSWRVCGSV
jgi:hypothetical protein